MPPSHRRYATPGRTAAVTLAATAAVTAAAVSALLLTVPVFAAGRLHLQPGQPSQASQPRQQSASSDAAELIARGDAAWKRRAEGHLGPRASPGPIGEAIAAYEQALRLQPDRLETCWKLLRAEHFKGDFVAATREQKQAVFGPARAVAEAGLDRLARKVGGRERLDAMAPQTAARALTAVPEAAPLHLWAAIHWGLWGDNFGRLAAARQGVGDRVRRYAEVVIAIDERFEDAGGHRVLGRLHTLAPKVPFLTGWVDRDKAVAELRRAVALAPDYPLNPVFLAEALLQYQPAKAAEARQLLRRVVEARPSPEREVEDADAIAQARVLLAKYRG